MTRSMPDPQGYKSGEKKNTAGQKFESGSSRTPRSSITTPPNTLSLSLFIFFSPGGLLHCFYVGIPHKPAFPDSSSGLRSWLYCHEPDLTSARSVLDNSDLGPDCGF